MLRAYKSRNHNRKPTKGKRKTYKKIIPCHITLNFNKPYNNENKCKKNKIIQPLTNSSSSTETGIILPHKYSLSKIMNLDKKQIKKCRKKSKKNHSLKNVPPKELSPLYLYLRGKSPKSKTTRHHMLESEYTISTPISNLGQKKNIFWNNYENLSILSEFGKIAPSLLSQKESTQFEDLFNLPQ